MFFKSVIYIVSQKGDIVNKKGRECKTHSLPILFIFEGCLLDRGIPRICKTEIQEQSLLSW